MIARLVTRRWRKRARLFCGSSSCMGDEFVIGTRLYCDRLESRMTHDKRGETRKRSRRTRVLQTSNNITAAYGKNNI